MLSRWWGWTCYYSGGSKPVGIFTVPAFSPTQPCQQLWCEVGVLLSPHSSVAKSVFTCITLLPSWLYLYHSSISRALLRCSHIFGWVVVWGTTLTDMVELRRLEFYLYFPCSFIYKLSVGHCLSNKLLLKWNVIQRYSYVSLATELLQFTVESEFCFFIHIVYI